MEVLLELARFRYFVVFLHREFAFISKLALIFKSSKEKMWHEYLSFNKLKIFFSAIIEIATVIEEIFLVVIVINDLVMIIINYLIHYLPFYL